MRHVVQREEADMLSDALRDRPSPAEHSRVLCELEQLSGELAQAKLELHNAGAADRRRCGELAQDVDDWRALAEEALDARTNGERAALWIRFEALTARMLAR